MSDSEVFRKRKRKGLRCGSRSTTEIGESGGEGRGGDEGGGGGCEQQQQQQEEEQECSFPHNVYVET